MAGIGFTLRKLFKDKSCFGYAKAYALTGMVMLNDVYTVDVYVFWHR